MKDHIKHFGFRTDIDELCEMVDCFVHPSISEGLGIVALDGMTVGLSVLDYDVGEIWCFVIDGEIGRIKIMSGT